MDIAVEELLKKTGSAYKLVILAARRAVELNEGVPKLVDCAPNEKTSTIALREIMEDRIIYRVL